MAVSLPHIADRDAVIAQDATQNAYTASVDVVSGVRYAVGFATLYADRNKAIVVSVNGASVATRTTSAANLANTNIASSSDWFEDGIIWESDTTGTVTIEVATAVPDSLAIDGVVIREPTLRSGIVEDQGSGTHCHPVSWMHGGKRYQLHAEMYTGAIHLSIDSVPKGEVFPPIAADYNERYHNGCFGVSVPGGVAIFRTGHSQPNLDTRFLPLGDIGDITPVVNLSEATGRISYGRAVSLADGTVVVVIRGSTLASVSNTVGSAVIIEDIHLLGSDGHSYHEDTISTGFTFYPTDVQLLSDDGKEVVVVQFHQRTLTWGQIHLCLYSPSEGKWYTIAGDEAANNTEPGTIADPRFSSAQLSTITANGNGTVILDAIGGSNQYPLQSGFYRITQWPTSLLPAIADASFPFVVAPGNMNDYGDVTYMWAMMSANVLYTSSTDFAGPAGLSANSYRQIAVCYEDENQDKWLAITNRGTRLHENRYAEETQLYYDWGTSLDIKRYAVYSPFDPGIGFSDTESKQVSTPLSAGWMTRVQGSGVIIYENALNELHPTHRQSSTAAVFSELESLDMAERYLIASGNVSNPANWFSGEKPTIGDTAHANGFVGQIDENIAADTWTSAAGAVAVAGGNFNILDGFTLTGNVAAGTGVAATAGAVTYGGVGEAIIDGSVLAGQTAAQHGVSFHTNFGAATGYLTITGDVQGGAGSASRGVRWTPGNGATLDIHGRVLGGEGPSTNSHGIIIDTGTSKTLIVRNNVESRASDGININGQCTLWTILGNVVSGGDGTRFGIGVIQSGWSKAGMVGNIYGSLIGGQIADAGGIALTCNAEDEITINVHGSSVANAARACRIYGNSNATINVFGGANGGYRSGANAIAVESGAAIIDVRGASVGGSHPDAHGILNQSTSTIRVGGQSITNPSGALGVNNPGNGQVVIGYADFFSPVLRFVTEGVTPKLVIGSWAKNATHITVANPTIDVKDASFNSVIGGPQAMTVDGTDPRLMKYEHGSNIFARGNPYFLIFGGEHEGQPIPETIHPIRF